MSVNWKRLGKYGLLTAGAVGGGLAIFANMPPGVSYMLFFMFFNNNDLCTEHSFQYKILNIMNNFKGF